MPNCPECGADVGTEMASSCPTCGVRLTIDDYERSDGGYRPNEDDPWDDTGGESGTGDPTEDPWGNTGGESGTGAQWGETGGNAGRADSTTDQWGESADEPRTADPKPDDEPNQRGLLDFSLNYPVAGGYKQLAIGSGLFAIGFLIVPLLALYGYGIRLGRAAMRGDPTPPQYDDWGGLIGDGFRLVVVSIPYVIVAAVAIGVPVYFESWGIATLLYLPVFYVGGAIYPTFLATGSVTKTYSDLRFLKLAATVDYLKGVTVLFVLQFALMIPLIIATMILTITIVGILLLPVLFLVAAAYVSYLTDAVWGHVYYTAAAKGSVPPLENVETLGTRF